jgi:hypothetical protein
MSCTKNNTYVFETNTTEKTFYLAMIHPKEEAQPLPEKFWLTTFSDQSVSVVQTCQKN